MTENNPLITPRVYHIFEIDSRVEIRKTHATILNMGKALFVAMFIAAIVFGGLFLFNHAGTSNLQNINVNIKPSPTPYHIVIATPSGILTPSASPSSAATMEKPTAKQATITTSKGDIVLTLYPDVAPIAVANFVKKAQSGFYNGLDFHRVENWVIQGGDPKGNGTGGNDMQTELNSKPFVTGSLGMAGHPGPDGKTINNDAQFFIVKSDSSWLNGQYTNFGIVKAGMDVVQKIAIGDKILGITIQ